jgi:hypothetical protein
MLLCESSLEIGKEFQDDDKKKYRKDRKKKWKKEIHNKQKEEDRIKEKGRNKKGEMESYLSIRSWRPIGL